MIKRALFCFSILILIFSESLTSFCQKTAELCYVYENLYVLTIIGGEKIVSAQKMSGISILEKVDVLAKLKP